MSKYIDYKELPKDIDWELGDQFDEAGDGYCFDHEIYGYSESTGKSYEGSAAVVHDEIAEIYDVFEVIEKE